MCRCLKLQISDTFPPGTEMKHGGSLFEVRPGLINHIVAVSSETGYIYILNSLSWQTIHKHRSLIV